MLDWIRMHWFDLGIIFALVIGLFLFTGTVTQISFILWLSFITLFIHQFEEYRYPGYFPGMMNIVMFASNKPDRYPLNPNISLIINVGIGWFFYFIAALYAESFIWLGIATILVSVGNFFAHTFLFNIKGKTVYNPGMATALILFLPLSLYFFYFVFENNLATMTDWIIGTILGLFLNVVGIIKLIDWLKDENTSYLFPKRFLIPSMRNQ